MAPRGRPSGRDGKRPVPDGGIHDTSETAARRVVVLNPASGDGTHVDEVYELADDYGYAVSETEQAGDVVDLTRDAIADGAEQLAACGGDGTINEAVRGIQAADAFEEVSFGVLPGGTGNNFALNVGVESISQGFEVLEDGEIRQVDVGMAGERPFVNSCVGGLTATASSETSSELKERFGVLAYVLETFETLSEFEGFELRLDSPESEDHLWEGSAVSVLIGNARRVGSERVVQADMEDGLFDITIVESMPPAELLETAAVYRLFGEDRDSVTRLKAPSIEVVVEGTETVEFSLDGEIMSLDRLSASVLEGVLSLHVGESYEPHPDEA